jgi:hypothetical protein
VIYVNYVGGYFSEGRKKERKMLSGGQQERMTVTSKNTHSWEEKKRSNVLHQHSKILWK